ncbi:MAG TPA: hypothetical protein PKW15_03590, partial [Alphaproteobacteria bacterium]|nr:hypothetical protein [Alphaproteobacteria bacterium]
KSTQTPIFLGKIESYLPERRTRGMGMPPCQKITVIFLAEIICLLLILLSVLRSTTHKHIGIFHD